MNTRQRSSLFTPPRAIAVSVVLGLGLAGVVPAAASADDSAFTGTVSIVHINDVHANTDPGSPGIGYGKVAAYADQARAENPDTLFLDAGDVFAGTPYSAFDNGESLVPVLNTLGLDAMTAGNAEFTYGSAQYLTLVNQLDYPSLVGNMAYRDTGLPIGPTTTTVDLPNGMTVGLVGVTTPLSAAMGAMDLEYVDAVEVARQGIAELQEDEVDLIVGLVHLGELDSVMSSHALAEAIPDFDVIIDGHSHTPLPNGTVVNGTLIAQAGGFSEFIGHVDLELEDGAVTGVTARLLDQQDLADLEPKTATEDALQTLRDLASASLSSVVGSTSVLLDGNRTRVRTGEAEVANLFTDAIREETGADFVMLGAGFIGGNVPPGEITRRQVFEIARVDTGILTKRMTGAGILQYLERVTQDYPLESGTFPHVSGGSFRLDVDGAPRIHSVVIGGQPLDPAAQYTVAIPYGGNDLPGSAGAELLYDHGSATPMLEGFIADRSPVAPVLEQRFAVAATPVDPGPPVDPEPPVDPVEQPFVDVPVGHRFFTEISWMRDEGLSTGIRRGAQVVFEPKSPVTREAMAAFLFRLEAPKDYRAPKVSPFSDVPTNHKFYREIAWMAESGLSTGVKQTSGKPKFLPQRSITREAVAAFMFRKDAEKGYRAPASSPFSDVATNHKFYREIAWMAESGLSTGIRQASGKPKYAPQSSTSREATAAFLYRAVHR